VVSNDKCLNKRLSQLFGKEKKMKTYEREKKERRQRDEGGKSRDFTLGEVELTSLVRKKSDPDGKKRKKK